MTESTERRAAHERLATGGLARWMRRCATHPWRVIGAWLGIFAVLAVLTISFAGSLRDEFEIPGSDTQKATDLIEAEFAEEQGGVLNVVFAAPPGQRLDTPEREQAIDEAIVRLRGSEFKPTDDVAGLESVETPFTEDTVSDDGRIAYAEAQFDRVIYEKDRESVVAVQEAVRETVEPAGVQVEFNGDAEFPPIEQGTQELLGLLAALIVLLIVFRTFVATSIPLALAITAVATAFLLLFLLAGLTDINTITPLLVSMIGIGVGIDYSLFIVTRFRQLLHDGMSPADAAAEAGSSAGRAVLFAGLTVAISVSGLAIFGLDFVTKLGIGSALGVLTTVLIANSLLIAVLSKLGHKIDRLKVPFLRPIDDSEEARQKTPIARWGRFVTRNARIVFPVLLVAGWCSRGRPPLSGSAPPTRGRSRSRRRARRTTCSPRASAPASTRRSIVVDVNGDEPAPRRCRERAQPSRRSLRRRAGLQRPEDRGDRVREAGLRAAGRGDGAARRHTAQATSSRRRPKAGTRRLRLRPDGGVRGHRRPHHGAPAVVPAVRDRRHVPRARDGVPLGSRGTAAVTTILSAFVGFGVLT